MDIEQPGELLAYLKRTGRVPAADTVRVHKLTGGVSNRTMLVARDDGPDWVVKQALGKLRVEADWFCDPQRIHREAAGLRTLEKLLPAGAVPHFVFEDAGQHLLGMTAIAQPHENWKSELLSGRLELEHIEQSADLLGTIHRTSGRATETYQELFADWTYFEALRLEPYYGYAAEQTPEAEPFLRELIEQTRAKKQTLVHGDFSPKNILIHDEKLILLDHEVIHWGDPTFDCGFFLAHLLSKAHHLEEQRQEFLNAARWWFECYRRHVAEEPWATSLESDVVAHTLACLLARVRGRSRLEYLSEAQHSRQLLAVIPLVLFPPANIGELVEGFQTALDAAVRD